MHCSLGNVFFCSFLCTNEADPNRDALTGKDCLTQIARLRLITSIWQLTGHVLPRRRLTPQCCRRRRRRRADSYDSAAAAACLKLRRRRRDRRGATPSDTRECACITRSESTKMSRSRTEDTGETVDEPTVSVAVVAVVTVLAPY